jgi:hypothetical protein
VSILGNENVCAAGRHVDDEAADDGQRVRVVLEVRQHVHDRVSDFSVDRLASPAI